MLEFDRIDISEGIGVNKQICQKYMIFVTVGILKIMVLSMKRFFVMVVTI